MKKVFKLVAMLLCVVSLTSLSFCSKDNTNNGNRGNGGNPLLIGKWKSVDAVADDGNPAIGDHGFLYIGKVWEFEYLYTDEEGDCYMLYVEGMGSNGRTGNIPVFINGNKFDMSAGMWGVYTIVQLTSSTLELEGGNGIAFSSITLTKL